MRQFVGYVVIGILAIVSVIAIAMAAALMLAPFVILFWAVFTL